MAESGPASVLDASSLMAVLHTEDGAAVVIDAIAEGAAFSVVNWAEVLSKLAEAGKDPGLRLPNCVEQKARVARCRSSR